MAVPAYPSAPNSNPATNAAAVTLDAPLARAARAFYIGGAGNLALTMEDGTTTTFQNVAVGIFPVGGRIVAASGTTATNIVALF